MSLLQCHQSNSDPTKFSFHKRDPVFITILIETEITHSYFCHFCIHTNGFHVFIYFVIFYYAMKNVKPHLSLCLFCPPLCEVSWVWVWSCYGHDDLLLRPRCQRTPPHMWSACRWHGLKESRKKFSFSLSSELKFITFLCSNLHEILDMGFIPLSRKKKKCVHPFDSSYIIFCSACSIKTLAREKIKSESKWAFSKNKTNKQKCWF